MLAEARLTLGELGRKNTELLQTVVDQLKGLIEQKDTLNALKDAEITRLKADLKLLGAATVSTVDQVHRDGIEPPQPKKYLN